MTPPLIYLEHRLLYRIQCRVRRWKRFLSQYSEWGDAGASGSGQKKGRLVVGSGLKGEDIECGSRGRWGWSSDERRGSGREARAPF